MSRNLYEIVLPSRQWVPLSQEKFYQATDGAVMPQDTLVRLKRDEAFLYVEFDCKNDPYWTQTTHCEHNTDLWQQEVFEVFIAEGASTPTRYLEVEINPNNALFVGWVDNVSKEGDAIVLTMVPYEEAGIVHQITETTADSWRGQLKIPIELLSNQSADWQHPAFRINFYRIVLLKPQSDPQWVCDPSNASFQCWSPTLSGNTPRFHRPDSFGVLRFV